MHKKLRPMGCNVKLFPKKGPTTTLTSNILSLCVYSLTFTHFYRCTATIKKNSFCYLRRANVLSELDNKEDNTKTHTQMSNAITLET